MCDFDENLICGAATYLGTFSHNHNYETYWVAYRCLACNKLVFTYKNEERYISEVHNIEDLEPPCYTSIEEAPYAFDKALVVLFQSLEAPKRFKKSISINLRKK